MVPRQSHALRSMQIYRRPRNSGEGTDDYEVIRVEGEQVFFENLRTNGRAYQIVSAFVQEGILIYDPHVDP